MYKTIQEVRIERLQKGRCMECGGEIEPADEGMMAHCSECGYIVEQHKAEKFHKEELQETEQFFEEEIQSLK